jgi:hypothetical protein
MCVVGKPLLKINVVVVADGAVTSTIVGAAAVAIRIPAVVFLQELAA